LKKVAIRIKMESSCSMLAQHVIIIESDKFVPLKNLSFLPGLLPLSSGGFAGQSERGGHR
jgi:hypothetical protein